MLSVSVTGSGLVCSLGNSVDECTVAMFSSTVNAGSLQLTEFSEPMNVLWYGIEDTVNDTGVERFYRLLEQAVDEAIDSAGISRNDVSRAGLFLGSSSFDLGLSELCYRESLARQGSQALAMEMVSYGQLAGYLRRQKGLRGPDFTYGTACSASANAVLAASRMLAQGQIEHALVVGVDLYNATTIAGFYGLQSLSTDRVRPFDRHRSGMILGESCSAVVLSAKSAMDGSGTTRVLGGASNCDTTSVTATNSDGSRISDVIQEALQDAAVREQDVGVVKAHATASHANDLAEANGMLQVFSRVPPVCALKSCTGHTLGACGVTELVLMSEALKKGLLPGTPGFTSTDPQLGISPLTENFAASQGKPCLLNYFGFGGNNTALVIQHG